VIPARFYVGVTDEQWFRYLQNQPSLDEVNFWSPGGRIVRAERGTPFLFKLKAPRNVIGGMGFISFVERMPIRDAWEFFQNKNGASSLAELTGRIAANRPGKSAGIDDVIGCTVLSQSVFFASPVAQPEDWPPNLQGGKYYSPMELVGQRVWRDASIALSARSSIPASPFGGYGEPVLQAVRLGQGAFRKLVLDAYGRRCAVSGEHTVPSSRPATFDLLPMLRNTRLPTVCLCDRISIRSSIKDTLP
jgi:putative restriction endonuclease